ncbi:MAG: hypothetical protein EXS51_01020 [Candidatus Taylorbacteria bacterium]|nr:hypothetical protein [Candidatus Taylorbacteria bacterium]
MHLEKVKEEGKTLQKEVRERTLGFITAGLGLVAGLAWNDAIKALIEYLFPLDKNGLLAKFLYAIIITLVVVLLSVYLVRWLKKEEKNS